MYSALTLSLGAAAAVIIIVVTWVTLSIAERGWRR